MNYLYGQKIFIVHTQLYFEVIQQKSNAKIILRLITVGFI